MRNFYTLAGFPKVIGAIDCTLISIRAPSKEEHLYMCHKEYHAMNVMAVCNADMRFTNLVTKWHGSAHGSVVFNASALQLHMETREKGGWLLGDRGYALQPYLITTLNPEKVNTPGEQNYQRRHTKTRNVVERSFGLLKQRFRCLDFSGGACNFRQIAVATLLLQQLFPTICA